MVLNGNSFVRITVIFCVVSYAFGNHNGCKRAKVFRKNRVYLYSYAGTVENGIKGASENAAKMRITAKISIQFIGTCEYSMRLKKVKVEESFKDAFEKSPRSVDLAKSLEQFPIRFLIDNGLIKDVRPVLRERQKDILNIKRGILSAFQMKWSKKKIVKQVDVSGICDVRYEVERHKDGRKNVTKTKLLSSCEKRTFAHSNIEAIQFKKVSSIYDAKSSCVYNVKKKHEIERISCNEYYLLKPFSTSTGAGSYTNVSQVLWLQNVKRHRNKKTELQEVYSTSLLFEHEHEEGSKSSDGTSTINVLHRLVDGSQNSPLIASRFTELVYAFRSINEQGIGQLMPQLKTCFSATTCDEARSDSYKSFFFDALAQCGTNACVNVLANLITSKKMPTEQIDNALTALNFIQDPTPGMINAVIGIYKSTENPTALLLLGTLLHKLCQHRPTGCQRKGTIRSVLYDAEFFLMRLLGNDCRNGQKDRNKVIYYALKAIGNAGRPVKMTDVIIDCLKHAIDTKISVAAVQALRKMPLSDRITNVLRTIVIDRNVDTERRIESFLMLMRDPKEADISLSVDMVNDEREAQQIRSFIHSFLSTSSRTKDSSKARYANLFKKVLGERNRINFDPAPTRYSKVYGNSFFIDYFDIGGGISGHTIFHPESVIPRTVKLRLNAQILGLAVDVLEVDARMEGLEVYMEKIVGDNGYFSKEFVKQLFSIPENMKSSENSRKRRNPEGDSLWKSINILHNMVNMKESVPGLDLSIKVFGNEVRLLKLEDIPMLNGELDNVNVLKLLYSLTKGKSASLQRSALFLEGSYVVPTVLGMPLAFEMNGSAAFSLHLNGKAKVSNLIMGPKMVNLQGSAAPGVSLDVSGKVTVYGIASKAGLRFHSSTHAANKLSGELNYKEGKQLKIKLDVPETEIDLFNYTHEMFHVVGNEELAISGSEKRAKLNICSEEIINISEQIGMDVCANLRFPVAYHDISAPFYPLSGPASVGFRLRKSDASLKFYHFDIIRKDEFFEMFFDTPGSLLFRMLKVKLGFDPLGHKGVAGVTLGNSEEGIHFNYEYDNITHGLKTNFTWNYYSGQESMVSTNFYNETDPATLDLKLGMEVNIVSPLLKGKSKFTFVDTYGFWGVDWLVDYGNVPFQCEVKVAYNPQTIFTRIIYGRKTFAIQLVPSHPVISYDMQIDWPPTRLNQTMKADLIQRRIKLVTNTSENSYSGEMYWLEANGLQKLILRAIKGPDVFQWLTQFNFKSRNKLISSKIKIKGKQYGMKYEFNRSSMQATVIGFPAKMRANLIQTPLKSGIKITGNVGSQFGQAVFFYKGSTTDGERMVCAQARILHNTFGICLAAIKSGGSKVVKLELVKDGMRSITKIVNFKQRVNSVGSVASKDVYKMESYLNGAPGLVATIEIDQSTRPLMERLSSLAIRVPSRNLSLDAKIPTEAVLTRQGNTTGWLKLDFESNQQDLSMHLKIANGFVPHGDVETSFDAKFVRKRRNGTIILSYMETTKENGRTMSVAANRESLMVLGNNVKLYEDRFAFAPTDGTIDSQVEYRSSKLSPLLTERQPISAVKKEIRSEEPTASFYGEIRVNPNEKRTEMYPRRLEANLFGNHASYDMDMAKRMARLRVGAQQFNASVRVIFSRQKEYNIVIDYSDDSTVINETKITISKTGQGDTWKVSIHHPGLNQYVNKLKYIYLSEYKQFHATLFNSSKEIIKKMALSKDSEMKLKNLIMLSVGTEALLKNRPQKWEALANGWRRLIKEIVKEHSNNWMGMKEYPMKAEMKNLIPRLNEMVESILSFEKLRIMIGKGGKLESSMDTLAEIAKSEELKKAVIEGSRKAMMDHKMPMETINQIMEVISNAMSDMTLSSSLPVLVGKLLRHKLNATLLAGKSVTGPMFNKTIESWKARKSDLLDALSNDERFLQFINNEIDANKELKRMMSDVLQRPIDNTSLSHVLLELASLTDLALGFDGLNVTKQEMIYKAGKRLLRKKLHAVIQLMRNPWKSRVRPILEEVMSEIDIVEERDFASNSTRVLFDVGGKAFNLLFDYVAKNFSSDTVADLRILMDDFLPKIMIGGLPLPQFWTRASVLLKDRFLFSLRLIAQLFPTKIEKFKQHYVRNDRILVEQIYGDFVRTDLTAPKNTKVVEEILENFSTRMFMEMAQATGNFSTGSSILNLLKLMRDIDLKDFDSAVKSYRKLKEEKGSEWSIPVLLDHLKDVVKSFGRVNIGNQTINNHIVPMIQDFNTLLPKMVKKTKAFEKMIKAAFKESASYVKDFSHRFREGVAKYPREGFGEDFANWQKLVKFGSDLTVPVFGTVRKLLKKELAKENDIGRTSNVQELATLLMKFDRFNLTLHVIRLIEESDDQPPEQALKTMLRKVAATAKDVERKVKKKMRVVERVLLSSQKELRSVLKNVRKFLLKRSTQPLHKIIQKAGKQLLGYVKSAYVNSSIIHDLQADFGSIYDFRQLRAQLDLRFKNATKVMERAFDSLDDKDLQVMASINLPNVLRGWTSKITNGMLVVLKRTDFARQVLSKKEYLRNPKEYLLNLPKSMMEKLREHLNQEKSDIFNWMSKVESSIKENLITKEILERLNLRTIHDHLKDIREDLGNLDHHAVIFKLLKKFDAEQFLSNETSALKHQMKILQKIMLDIVRSEGRSLLKWGDGNPLYEMSGKVANGQISYQEVVGNISVVMNKMRKSMKNVMNNVKTSIEKEGLKVEKLRNETYGTMMRMEESLVQIQHGFQSYVKIISESEIEFLIPQISSIRKNWMKYFVWNEHKSLSLNASAGGPPYIKYPDIHGDFTSRVMYNETIPMLTRLHQAQTVPSTVFISRTWAGKRNSELSRAKSVVGNAFLMTQRSIDMIPIFLRNGTKKYQEFLQRFPSDLDAFARSTYSQRIMEPLKRISSVATIPLPAEKLQSIIKDSEQLKSKINVLKPLPAVAIFSNQHIISFDGSYAYLPALKDNVGCTYLLSRDFRNGLFTILVRNGQLQMFIGKASIFLSRNGDVDLFSSEHGKVSNDLPAKIQGTLITATGSSIDIVSPFGLKITCDKELFRCQFMVPGIFHNKTLGIFGSNNGELADDFKVPNGRIIVDLLSFINSWKLNDGRKCRALKREDFTSECTIQPSRTCFHLFRDTRSPLAKAFATINPMPYYLACLRDTSECFARNQLKLTCSVASLYVKRCIELEVEVQLPIECAACRASGKPSMETKSMKYSSHGSIADIILIIRDSFHSKKAVRNLKYVLRQLDNHLENFDIDARYSLVGFGGIGHRFMPFIQTGNGEASGGIDNLISALKNLQFTSASRVQNGLSALKFASSQINFRPFSSKIFIVLDTVAVYSGSLRQLIDANSALTNQAVILNVINKYKFRRNVIGQDSSNMRYHLKIPKGEERRNLFFHTSDDYVPIVKESAGAILAAKGLISSNEKWRKAFPISLNQIILNQIINDRSTCKSCSCVKDDWGFPQFQCSNAIRDRC